MFRHLCVHSLAGGYISITEGHIIGKECALHSYLVRNNHFNQVRQKYKFRDNR